MRSSLTPERLEAINRCRQSNEYVETWTEHLKGDVHAAVKAGVPILTLANALGVSRSRIRVLAR